MLYILYTLLYIHIYIYIYIHTYTHIHISAFVNWCPKALNCLLTATVSSALAKSSWYKQRCLKQVIELVGYKCVDLYVCSDTTNSITRKNVQLDNFHNSGKKISMANAARRTDRSVRPPPSYLPRRLGPTGLTFI